MRLALSCAAIASIFCVLRTNRRAAERGTCRALCVIKMQNACVMFRCVCRTPGDRAQRNIRCAHGSAIPQEDGWPFGGACVHAHLRGHVHGPRAPAWACARRRCVRLRSIDARGAPQRKKRKQGRRRTKDATVRHEARVAPRETGRRRRRCTQGGSNGAPRLRPQCVCQNLTSCSSLVNVAGGPFDRRTPSRVSRLQESCKGCRFATAAQWSASEIQRPPQMANAHCRGSTMVPSRRTRARKRPSTVEGAHEARGTRR